jgi:hypothetical protein
VLDHRKEQLASRLWDAFSFFSALALFFPQFWHGQGRCPTRASVHKETEAAVSCLLQSLVRNVLNSALDLYADAFFVL